MLKKASSRPAVPMEDQNDSMHCPEIKEPLRTKHEIKCEGIGPNIERYKSFLPAV
jgi:hypothetical protein